MENSITMSNKLIKGAIKSKTIWFNTIITALVTLEGALPLLSTTLGDKWYGIVMVTLTVGNVLLRGVTTKALGDK